MNCGTSGSATVSGAENDETYSGYGDYGNQNGNDSSENYHTDTDTHTENQSESGALDDPSATNNHRTNSNNGNNTNINKANTNTSVRTNTTSVSLRTNTTKNSSDSISYCTNTSLTNMRSVSENERSRETESFDLGLLIYDCQRCPEQIVVVGEGGETKLLKVAEETLREEMVESFREGGSSVFVKGETTVKPLSERGRGRQTTRCEIGRVEGTLCDVEDVDDVLSQDALSLPLSMASSMYVDMEDVA